MSIDQVANASGLVGVVIILIAYGLLQFKTWQSDDIFYSLFNAVGSALIIFSLVYEWNLSAFVMEVAWLLVSLYGLCQPFFKKRITPRPDKGSESAK